MKQESEPTYLPTPEEIAEKAAIIREDHMNKRRAENCSYYHKSSPGIREFHTSVFRRRISLEETR